MTDPERLPVITCKWSCFDGDTIEKDHKSDFSQIVCERGCLTLTLTDISFSFLGPSSLAN